jgi:aminodeoxychorismate synthase component I
MRATSLGRLPRAALSQSVRPRYLILRAKNGTEPPLPPFCLIEDSQTGGALLFESLREKIVAFALEDVAPALAAMQAASAAGFHLAGLMAYECGYAFEPRLHKLPPARGGRPLLQFGVFDAPRRVEFSAPNPASVADARPTWDFDAYRPRFDACRDYIAAGDVYQINLTFPFTGRYQGAPLDLYALLRRRQPAQLGGVVALGDRAVVSLSPERFFSTQGRKISTRPMKGTAPRDADPSRDAALALALARDEKNRAENLMIVDLLRNDLSRLSEIGSVVVTDLYSVASFPTLHQMTSGVEAILREKLTFWEIFAGLFPCGSVTGAPKIRAMEIIAEQEGAPRENYCGALGHIAPDGDMRFNVAIRTLTLDGRGGLVCPVGSAIVADSQAREEYAECLLKARFLISA